MLPHNAAGLNDEAHDIAAQAWAAWEAAVCWDDEHAVKRLASCPTLVRAREKYGSLEALNRAWGAVFWNQTYTDWAQVRLTGPTPSDSPNPHQALDEKRFFSDSAISFARIQAEILRELAPNHWVTTNGIFGHLDSHRMTDELLDFISYDSYPNFSTIRSSFQRNDPPETCCG